ncbi:MAG: hypothetical protein ACI8ZF_000861 [Candidatus Midichloriaceae bacterium]|jgi:hypothetical protein
MMKRDDSKIIITSSWDATRNIEYIKKNLNDVQTIFPITLDFAIESCNNLYPSTEKGLAFGCHNPNDVKYLIDNNIITPKCNDKSHKIAQAQYSYSLLNTDDYFSFEDWHYTCGFTQAQIKGEYYDNDPITTADS